MVFSTTRKQKVTLEDYAYERDITMRQLLSSFKGIELTIVEELLNGSLNTSYQQISQSLECDISLVKPLMEKLSEHSLVKIKGEHIQVNKEQRKLFDSEMEKFRSSFMGDLTYLQDSLSKVPIHLLTQWYAIPKSSDNIFLSLIEKFMATPKTYAKYLEELATEAPLLFDITKQIEMSDDFFVSAEEIMRKNQLTPKQFHEAVLELEYNFAGCHCFRFNEENPECWEEGVTLLYEWKEFLTHQKKHSKDSITEERQLTRYHASPFGFLEDLNNLLAYASKNNLPIPPLEESALDKWQPFLIELSCTYSQTATLQYLKHLVGVARQLHLIGKNDKPVAGSAAYEGWLKLSKQEQAMGLYSVFLNSSRNGDALALGLSEKEFREIERNLKIIQHGHWVMMDDFINGCTAAIGKRQPVTLERKGTRWRFQLPRYEAIERELIRNAIKHPFFYSGLVAIGSHNGKECFSVTPLGRMHLG